MPSIKRIFLVGLASLVIVGQLIPGSVLAAGSSSSTPGQALEIAPPLLELSGNPGQTLTANIDIRDIASGPLLVTNQINNFVAKGDTGIPEILLNNKTPDPYSLSGFIPPLPTLLLQPEQIKQLPITINIPIGASPGGHYGVIRFTGTPASLTGSSGVSLSASLGTLVLLTVGGNIKEHLITHSFFVSQNSTKPSSFFQNDPISFNEVLTNNGNEHVVPTGIVTLKDMFGHVVASMNINEADGNILPGSSRAFSETLNSVDFAHKRLFGRYSASFIATYGAPKQTLTGLLTFWVIPINLIIIWLVVLIGGFFLIRWSVKRYNQHILDKAQKK